MKLKKNNCTLQITKDVDYHCGHTDRYEHHPQHLLPLARRWCNGFDSKLTCIFLQDITLALTLTYEVWDRFDHGDTWKINATPKSLGCLFENLNFFCEIQDGWLPFKKPHWNMCFRISAIVPPDSVTITFVPTVGCIRGCYGARWTRPSPFTAELCLFFLDKFWQLCQFLWVFFPPKYFKALKIQNSSSKSATLAQCSMKSAK